MKKPFLTFGAPDLGEAEIAEVVDCLRSGWIGTGPRVAQFERDFAAYLGQDASRVAAMNSCTAALHIALVGAGFEPGSEVITTPLTFCATVNAIIHAGLTPVLADVDPVTRNIDPAAIEAAITPRTRAILPVHLAGLPCEMDEIVAIAKKHDLEIIEDCAHAIETEYRGRRVGSDGRYGCYSFYVTKNVVTGEGGMLIGRDESDVARARVLALHGMSKDAWHRFGDKGYKHYQVVECGFKYNMMDMQAALGLHQLAKVEQSWKRREAIWRAYQSAFVDTPIGRPIDGPAHVKHAYHLYSILVDGSAGVTRDEFLDRMNALGVGTGVHYQAVSEHPYYQQRFGWNPDAYPHARDIGRATVSIPLSPKLGDSDVERVVEAVKSIVTGDVRARSIA